MLNKKTISSRLAIFLLLVLLVFLGDQKFKQWQNQRAIEQQTQSLEAQADSLQKKNDELSQSLDYLNSSSFKERVAREQLNLKKDGENVYSFSNAPQSQSTTQALSTSSNMQKWWNYFFSVN